MDLPEYQGTAEEVSRQKCEEAAKHIECPVLVEDTSLCFNALNGMPGPYIKWFLKSVGPEGLYKMVSAFDDHSAYAQCIFAYKADKNSPVELFSGKCPGKIVPPRGPTNFGWDPCFEPEQQDTKNRSESFTFAEMPSEEKNNISHRSKALNLLKEALLKS